MKNHDTEAPTTEQAGGQVIGEVRREAAGASTPHSYVVPGDALEFGASLGNAHCWLTTHGNGSIQDIFSTDIGQTIANTISIRYGSTGHHVLRASPDAASLDVAATTVQLSPVSPGNIELHPAYQRHTFWLPGQVKVQETVFVPFRTGDDPAVAYYQVELSNQSGAPRALCVRAFAHLVGTLGPDLAARFERDGKALVVANRGRPSAARVFGCTDEVSAFQTTHDFGCVYDMLHMAALTNDTSAEGDILVAIEVDVALAPEETRSMAFVLAFSDDGEAAALAHYRQARAAVTVLADTIAYLTKITSVSQVLTPDQTINVGVLWSKVNMLRVMARYPQGPAFTNEPGVSSAVVGRDAAWFVYGNDHLLPSFSRALLNAFAARQYPDGRIPEFFNAVTNAVDDYGLNINDDTPLFVLAVNHHFRATGDLGWLGEIFGAVAAAARYILAQKDERGLISCSARDPRGNVWAIAGWRNVIPGYTLNGAVTEINAECVAALRAAAHLGENLGLPHTDWQAFEVGAKSLREAMDTHLINPRNGLYYLNIDADGITHTDVTGDQIFPVMFRTCPEDVGYRIISRLNYPDFWTPAGLRTASTADPRYNPARNVGLIGGVWPGLTWWYAFGAARYHPELLVRALAASFAHYAADPRSNNTVPGQFSEWFDGESLVNRGMRLSPWEPPRFLWAAVEGVCGVVLQPGQLKINPLVPAHWRWVGLRKLPYHGAEISFFAIREDEGKHAGQFHIYATAEVATKHELSLYAEDVTEAVGVLNPRVCHLALRRPDEVVLLLGNTSASTTIVPLELDGLLARDATYTVHLYDSESHTWRRGETCGADDVRMPAVTIEAGGFRVLRLVETR
ncbi:MAG TPA: amylo-alpha-1,6-glucosidase [Chloroflexota bacterium]|nr:amylo-alpha-1,6-glucosidase [Chloroflexota bacterium]